MLKPAPLKVLVERRIVPGEEETESGIIKVNMPTEKPNDGTVVAIGDEIKRYRVGDVVHFKKFGWETLRFEDKEYLALDEDDILATE